MTALVSFMRRLILNQKNVHPAHLVTATRIIEQQRQQIEQLEQSMRVVLLDIIDSKHTASGEQQIAYRILSDVDSLLESLTDRAMQRSNEETRERRTLYMTLRQGFKQSEIPVRKTNA